jgi:hypothetical protein
MPHRVSSRVSRRRGLSSALTHAAGSAKLVGMTLWRFSSAARPPPRPSTALLQLPELHRPRVLRGLRSSRYRLRLRLRLRAAGVGLTVEQVAASVPVFEFGEVSQDSLLRDAVENESGSLDLPSLTDIGSFSGDVQRLWATVQGLQGSCNSSVARAAQSLCSLAFRAVDPCGVAAHDLPPNLLPFVCTEVADNSDSDSVNDLQHQQQRQLPQLSEIFRGVSNAPASNVPLTQVLHSFATIDRNLRISSPHKSSSSSAPMHFEDAASLVGAMASAHSLAPRLWDETIEVMRGVETLEDFAEDSNVSLLRHWHSQPLSDSDDDIEESADDLLLEGLGSDSLLDLVVDEVDGIGDDDGLDETDSLPRLRGSRPSSASANRRPSDRVRRSGRLQSPPDSLASAGGLGASNRGSWRLLYGGGGEMCRATYAPHSLSPVPALDHGNTPSSPSSQGRLSRPVPPLSDWAGASASSSSSSSNNSNSNGNSDGDDNFEEDSDGVSRVTYSPPAPSARAWPRPSDRIPAGNRRVMSAGCNSVLSGTSTAVCADAVTDARDVESGDEEMLWSGDELESDDVDVIALIDALDSGVSVSLDHSHSSRQHSSTVVVSSDDAESEGCDDCESQRLVGAESRAAVGRAWAEKVAFRSVNLPGAVESASSPRANSPSVSATSASSHDQEIIVEDVSDESDDSSSQFNSQCDVMYARHQPETFPQHDMHNEFPAGLPPSQYDQYDLSGAFEHARNRLAPADQPRVPSLPLQGQHDVTLDLAYTRASLAAHVPRENASRYGSTASASTAGAQPRDGATEAVVQSRFHLPGNDIGRSMQALWSLQVRAQNIPAQTAQPLYGLVAYDCVQFVLRMPCDAACRRHGTTPPATARSVQRAHHLPAGREARLGCARWETLCLLRIHCLLFTFRSSVYLYL